MGVDVIRSLAPNAYIGAGAQDTDAAERIIQTDIIVRRQRGRFASAPHPPGLRGRTPTGAVPTLPDSGAGAPSGGSAYP